MILGAVHHTILAILFAVVAILLMIVILLQRGRGVGLAGAFGGAGGASAFGAKTGDVLTWVTVVGAAVLLIFTVVLNFVFVEGSPGLGTDAQFKSVGATEPAAQTGPAATSPGEGGSPPTQTSAAAPTGAPSEAPAAPAVEPAEPAPGPAEPAPGPAEPAPGPAEPAAPVENP